MRWLRFAIFVIVCAVLQAELVGVLAVTNLQVKPDLLLIAAVFFAVYSNRRDAIITSFSLGLAADLIGSTMGTYTISFGLFGTLLACLNTIVSIRKMLYQAIAILATGLLAGLLVCLLSYIKTRQYVDNSFMILLGTSLYSAIIGPFLFLPSAWWMRVKTNRFN